MTFINDDESGLWQHVFTAAVKAGKTADAACWMADDAVKWYRARCRTAG